MLVPDNFSISLRACISSGALYFGLLCGSPALHAQSYPGYHYQQRWPVDETIQHLKSVAAHNTYSNHEMERYDHAMTHLSQFAEKFQTGRFDRGKLDRGIDDLRNVLNHNPMDGRARDLLNNDLNELHRFRATYRYE